MHWDEPNVVRPFVNVFQGFHYLRRCNSALLSRFFYVCDESQAGSWLMVHKFNET